MIEGVNLFYKEGSSDKVYQASIEKKGHGYVVNFAYGRRGAAMTTGSKTPMPVSLDEAKKVYKKLVASKVSKGYSEDPTGKIFKTTPLEDRDTGVRPQLLNEIAEELVEKYIRDPNYCAQEKFDGRRKMILRTYSKTEGANRKGLVIPLDKDMLSELEYLPGVITLDGEDLGSKFVVFDAIDEDHKDLSYRERYAYLVTEWGEFTTMELADTAWSESQKRTLYQTLMDDKKEGIVFKDIRAPYKEGRPSSGGSQVKFKFYSTASCLVHAVNKKTRSIAISLLDMSSKPLKQVLVGNATVYPNQDIPEIGKIVEIKYLYAYPQGALYQPILLGKGDCTRNDIDTFDCNIKQLKFKPVEEEV